MIASEEFDHVQKLLGKKGKPRSKSKTLPFNGLLRCGECGCSITADEKIKYIKSTKSTKSYIYHRCNKKKRDIKCGQKQVTYSDIHRQVNQILDKVTIPECFLKFALDALNKDNVRENANRNLLIKNQQKALDDCVKRIDNFVQLYISPSNSKRELLSDEEFKDQKLLLLKEKTGIQSELADLDKRINEWVELTEKTFKFATYARYWFAQAKHKEKTDILRALGTNFVLKDGIISITLAKPYKIIEEGLKEIRAEIGTPEPTEIILDKAKIGVPVPVFAVLSG